MYSRRMVITGVVSAVTAGGCMVDRRDNDPAAQEHMGDGRTGALTASELATLVAITGRLIPSDESGAGAIEAHAAYYIDLALGDALAPQRGLYSTGLAAIDAYARLKYGTAFVALPPTAQDGVLQVVERGLPSESMEDSAAFFALLRDHTLQGTFCDPYYGGNAGYVGWDMIGYPGLRMMVTHDEQRVGAQLKPVHASAYDDEGYHRPQVVGHTVPKSHE